MLRFPAMHGKMRRRLFGLLTALVVFLLVEGIGRWAHGWVMGESYDRNAIEARRQGLAEDGPRALPEVIAEQGESRALHPFLGSVLDPDRATPFFFDRYQAVPGVHGFYAVEGGEAPAEGHGVVAIFGGSVATAASFAAREPLARRLEALLGRPVAFRSRALGSFKQPQQLQALSLHLSLGERYDVVINLDGFNELVLPMLFNRQQEVYPFYPRDWAPRVEAVDDLGTRRTLGRLTLEEEHRRATAALFSAPLLRHWSPWNLTWRVLDRRAEVRLAALQDALAAGSGERPYRSHGPEWDYGNHRETVRSLARQWAAASLQMHRLCQANGIRYIHFLQPNQYVPGSKPLHPAEERIGVTSRPRYGRFVAMGYPFLREEGEALRRQGVAFVDLTELFAAVEEPVYRDNCCHLNERGHRILGQAMAEGVAQAFTSPPAPSGR